MSFNIYTYVLYIKHILFIVQFIVTKFDVIIMCKKDERTSVTFTHITYIIIGRKFNFIVIGSNRCLLECHQHIRCAYTIRMFTINSNIEIQFKQKTKH